jgi:hypothetical protein
LLFRDDVAIITWTSNNPGGADEPFGIVNYGTDHNQLNQMAKSHIRLNRNHSYTVFRVRVAYADRLAALDTEIAVARAKREAAETKGDMTTAETVLTKLEKPCEKLAAKLAERDERIAEARRRAKEDRQDVDKVGDELVARRGDVLFNRTNSQEWVGKVGIYRGEIDTVFASYLIRLFPDTTRVDNYYLGHVLGSYSAQCRIKRYATPGVQQVNINATNLGKVLIPVPHGKYALAEQREIALMLEAADAVVRSHEPLLAAQQALKTSLMHDFLTGRVCVKSLAEAPTS